VTNTIIIYGPMACGKTRNADALRKHYGCIGIVDDFPYPSRDTLKPGHLHLSNHQWDDLKKFTSADQIIPFASAMANAGIEP